MDSEGAALSWSGRLFSAF